MAFVLSMKEIILPLLPLALILVPVPPLIVSSVVMLLLQPIVLIGLRCLLTISMEFYVEDLLIGPSLLLMTWISIAPLNIPVVALKLLILVLLFQSSVEVTIRPAVLFKFIVQFLDGLWLLSGQMGCEGFYSETFDCHFNGYIFWDIRCLGLELYKLLEVFP